MSPYFIEQAGSLVGQCVAVQADCMLKQGILRSVGADFLTLESHGIPFFIRTDQVVFVTCT